MSSFRTRVYLLVVITGGLVACGEATSSPVRLEEQRSFELGPMGGEMTVETRTARAFDTPSSMLGPDAMARHEAGDKAFEAEFAADEASSHSGLGPVFNNDSCISCHVRNGRGRPRIGTKDSNAHMLLRISDHVGPPVEPGGPNPVGEFGSQLQHRSIPRAEPEADVALRWERREGQFGNGETYTLRAPRLEIQPIRPDRWPDSFETSLRQTPPLVGLGLLEAVPEERILSRADPGDADDDGISGRPNRVHDPTQPEQDRPTALGRFGHKASTASLRHQVAAAFRNDMGISNPLFPMGDPEDETEIDASTLRATVFHVQSLGVPVRYKPSSLEETRRVRRGFELFEETGCAHCHTPTMKTGRSHPVEALHDQTIHPFTDLFLHDMGPGLADGRPDYRASGSEWRTPPLWGLGVTERLLPSAGYLHDGRARTLTEAILWHGGEAEASRERFRTMGDEKREALISFLETL